MLPQNLLHRILEVVEAPGCEDQDSAGNIGVVTSNCDRPSNSLCSLQPLFISNEATGRFILARHLHQLTVNRSVFNAQIFELPCRQSQPARVWCVVQEPPFPTPVRPSTRAIMGAKASLRTMTKAGI